MVLRDITVVYKQTILGFAWAILNPVFSMLVFTVVFGNLASVPSDGIPYPIFSFTALLPWTYFSASLSGATNSLVGSSGLFTKVYFPRIIIPLTPVLSKLADFFIAFSILVLLLIYYQVSPNINLIYLPLLIILMIMTSAGIGMWMSALAIQYRDVKFAITLLVQLLMYAAPVVFPASLVRDKLGEAAYFLYGLYPMTGVIEGFRAAIIGANPMPWNLIWMGSIVALVLFISGAFYFRKMERVFADVA
jgi:lipopolysaccharide transport system permease protein